MRIDMLRAMILIALIGLTAETASAEAVGLSFTFTASGTLGGVAFTDSLITLTVAGDADVTEQQRLNGLYAVIGGLAGPTVEISGVGVAGLLGTAGASSDLAGGRVYFEYEDGNGLTSLAGVQDAGLAGYRFASSVGPLTGPAVGGITLRTFATTAGDLRFTTLPDEVVLIATVRVAPAVPEPSSLALAGLGVLTLAGISVRRRRS